MIQICEVGPRDGLQTEKTLFSLEQKVEMIKRLVEAGLKKIEVVSFVNPRVIPQMANAEEVTARLPREEGVSYAGLVLNRSGLERSLTTPLDTLHVVLAVSDELNRRNTRRTVEQSCKELVPVIREAVVAGKNVVGVLGTSFGCPYEGSVPLQRVLKIADLFCQSGCREITLADTAGLAHPRQVRETVREFRRWFADAELGLHFHNTRGLGLSNVYSGYLEGVVRFDSSIGGLGGCPFTPKAAGNVCTEDMVNMFHRMGETTGTQLEKLVDTALWVQTQAGRRLDGMVMRASDPSQIGSK